MLLLIFFLLTWSAARKRKRARCQSPESVGAKEKLAPPGDVVVNVKTDGSVIVNRRTMTGSDWGSAANLAKLYPDQQW